MWPVRILRSDYKVRFTYYVVNREMWKNENGKTYRIRVRLLSGRVRLVSGGGRRLNRLRRLQGARQAATQVKAAAARQARQVAERALEPIEGEEDDEPMGNAIPGEPPSARACAIASP